jgi:hypothetical protein
MTALERVSHENNQIWKQAVRLALCRSIVSAKLIIRNDKEISSQKKEQLLTVVANNLEHRSDKLDSKPVPRRVQSDNPRKADERQLHEGSSQQPKA